MRSCHYAAEREMCVQWSSEKVCRCRLSCVVYRAEAAVELIAGMR